MKIQVVSDLHIDFSDITLESLGDVLVIAGDICAYNRHLELWIYKHLLRFQHIVYVAGNHEYYHRIMEYTEMKLRDLPVHFLQKDTVDIDGVRFAGCTLWTDFARGGMDEVRHNLMDYTAIRYDETELLHPSITQQLHFDQASWLANEAGEPDIVITHHAPSWLSVAPRFAGNALNPGFVSDADDLVRQLAPKYWIHGHTHTAMHYHIDTTTVVCNPRGYRHHAWGQEQTGWDPNLVLTL